MIPALLALTLLLNVVLLALVWMLWKRPAPTQSTDPAPMLQSLSTGFDRLERTLRADLTDARKEAAQAARDHRDEAREAARLQREEAQTKLESIRASVAETMKTHFEAQSARIDGFGTGLREHNASTLKSVDLLRTQVENRLKESQETTDKRLKESQEGIDKRLEQLRVDAATASKATREESGKAMQQFSDELRKRLAEGSKENADRLDSFSRKLSEMIESNDKRAEALRAAVEKQLDKLREENTLRLTEMQKVVDEKLQGTLEKRLGESFKQVSERLEQVHKGLGEMQTLATGVGDLKRVMTNVKTRGTWGEVQLGAILEQLLTPHQYVANIATRPGSSERVEYAIKLPGRAADSQEPVYLPIDAKFPSEDYQRLLDAQDAASPELVAAASRQLGNAIKSAARDISSKYIQPPHTTDFGVMFLPTEGLYAEVVRQVDLVEFCQRECRIVIAGPTTLAALLNSLQMGFQTLAIQKQSGEIRQVLGAVRTEFGKFGDVLDKVKKKLGEATNQIEMTGRRTRAMDRALRGIDVVSDEQAARLLGTAEPGPGAVEEDEEA